MEQKFLLNKITLGNRIVGWEVFSPAANGGEVIGMTAKTLTDAVKAGGVLGMVVDEQSSLQLNAAQGFQAMMDRTGGGNAHQYRFVSGGELDVHRVWSRWRQV